MLKNQSYSCFLVVQMKWIKIHMQSVILKYLDLNRKLLNIKSIFLRYENILLSL